jgi:hypothetical protein
MFLKTLKLSFTFYRNFFFASFSITLSCLFVYWYWHAVPVIAVVSFWFKVATYLMTFFHIKSAKRKEFYYYQALGISKTKLWIISLSIDFILFITLMSIANNLYHA